LYGDLLFVDKFELMYTQNKNTLTVKCYNLAPNLINALVNKHLHGIID